MFVGDPSLKAECGSHAPWHILAQVLELVASQGFTPWIGSRACALVVSSCHEVIPGGTKATIVGVDEEGDLPVFTDDGKTMATWCSIWLQVWERQCGPLDHASQPVQHCNCRNRMSKQHRKTSKNSCAKPSNVLLQIRWILCRSTSRGLAF